MNSRPRHAQILACDDVGGTELMVVMLARRASDLGEPTDVITLARPGPVAKALADAGIGAVSLGGRSTLATLWRLGGVLRSRNYRLVNVYGFRASVFVRGLVRLLRLRTIVLVGVQGLHVTETEHMDSAKARFAELVERLLSRWADAYEANSPGAVDFLRLLGIPSAKLSFVPNGIEVDTWAADTNAPLSANHPPVIVCTARFIPRKRQVDLLNAAAALRSRGVECQIVFAGEGPTLGACRDRADELGVEARFLGTLSQTRMREALHGADIFCLPSTWEGLPAALLEGMAAGLPVVGTAVNGIRDVVVDGHTGRLVPVSDPHSLADALESLLRNKSERQRLGQAGRDYVALNYGADVMVASKLRLYDRLISAASIDGASLDSVQTNLGT